MASVPSPVSEVGNLTSVQSAKALVVVKGNMLKLSTMSAIASNERHF